MANRNFDSIRPEEVTYFQFDFTNEIGGAARITSTNWTCAVSIDSILTDADAATRLVGTQMFSDTRTWTLAGNFLDGVVYTLTAKVTLSDGRVLIDDGDVECILRSLPVALTVEQFRSEFPAFASTQYYPTEQVQYWVNQALNFAPLDPIRWGQFYDQGLRLYVAHNLALERAMARAGARGAAPLGAGVPQSRGVNGVSVSYDVEMGSEQGAGAWNLTMWGSRFWRLQQLAGMGPVQV